MKFKDSYIVVLYILLVIIIAWIVMHPSQSMIDAMEFAR
jgi:hypothetical protein